MESQCVNGQVCECDTLRHMFIFVNFVIECHCEEDVEEFAINKGHRVGVDDGVVYLE